MIGKLTQKLDNVVFEKRHPLLWGAIHTYARSEKVVQGILKAHGKWNLDIDAYVKQY